MALAARAAARSRARLGPAITIPPAATRQEGNLIETVSKSQSPVTCHFLDGFIIAFPIWKKPGLILGQVKGIAGFPGWWERRAVRALPAEETLFQLIIQSINEKSYICLVVAARLNANRLLENLTFAPGWLRLRFWGLWGTDHHSSPMQGFPRESIITPHLDAAFWRLNSSSLTMENVLNTEPFNMT